MQDAPVSEPPSSPRRGWVARWLLRLGILLAALVLAGLLGEVTMRWTDFDAMGSAMGPRGLFEADDDLGVRLAAGYSGVHRHDEFVVDVAIGPFGLRDSHLQPELAPVLSLGDSFAYGFGVAADETWADVLEQRLTSAKGHAVSVVNAGMPSYGQVHMRLLLEDLAATLRPRIVTFTFFFPNDLEDNLRERDTIRHGYVCSPGVAANIDNNPRLDFALAHSLLLTYVEVESIKRRMRRAQPDRPAPRAGYPYHVQKLQAEPRPRMAEQWEAAAREIGLLADDIRALGAEPVLVRIPMPYQVDEATWERVLGEHDVDTTGLDREADLRQLEVICRDADVELVDLAPALSAAGGPALYYPANLHFNVAGHRVVGEALAERLAPELD